MNSETSSIADKSEMDATQLLRENLDLKRRIEDEEASYRRKLDTYRLAQQHQATLVSRLQTKVPGLWVRHVANWFSGWSTGNSLTVVCAFAGAAV